MSDGQPGKRKIDFESDLVKNTVNSAHVLYLSRELNKTTLIYTLVYKLAQLCDERKLMRTLRHVWEGKRRNVPVPTIEIAIIKELSRGQYTVTKPYRYKNKIYTLGDLNLELALDLIDIWGVLMDLIQKYNIKSDFDFNRYKQAASGLPQL